MYDVFEKKKIQLGPDVKPEDDAGRRLILNIVNSLSAKMEIGSPMASVYLLDYTGHQFVCFWWKSYVTYMLNSEEIQPAKRDNKDCKSGLETEDCDCVKIGQENGLYIATTNVDDYIHRPEIYSSVSLYEWTQSSHKCRATKKRA